MCVRIWTNLFGSVSSSVAWDNGMFWQRNIQEVIFYFVQEDKLVL